MNKLEFGDINRFLTSLGLIFIGLAFFLPWFVNQNNSLLLIENSKILKLTPTAQKIVEKQQNLLLEANENLQTLSISLIICGLIFLLVGIIKWWNRQSVLDEIQNEDLKTKKFQNISEEEKRKSIEKELFSVENIEENKDIKSSINEYLLIENNVFFQLSEKFKPNYIPNQNVRVNDYEYDIIFKSRDIALRKDRIIEIKMINNFLNYEILKIITEKLIFASNSYENLFSRKTMCVLVVAYGQNEYSEILAKYKTDLEAFGKSLNKFTKVIFVKKTDILEGKTLQTR